MLDAENNQMCHFLDDSNYDLSRPEARELRDLLAKTIRRSNTIADILDQSGVPVGKVEMDGSAELIWGAALKTASHQLRIRDLVTTVKAAYPAIAPQLTELEELGDQAPLSAENALVGAPPKWTDAADDSTLEKQLDKTSTLLDVVFMRQGLKAAQSVMMLEVHFGPAILKGTGFLISPRHILTNDHVATNQGKAPYKILVHQDYEVQPNGTTSSKAVVEIDAPNVIARERSDNPVRDWAVIELPSPMPKEIPTIDLNAAATPKKDERAYIIQHPGGLPKKVGLNRNLIRSVTEDHVQYLTDTEAGSSGSPVFNDKWQLIALHFRYIHFPEEPRFGYRNQGMRIEPIASALAGKVV